MRASTGAPPSLSAMKRVVITLAALAAFVVAVLLPALTSDSGASSEPETTTITRYLASFTVDANGDLTARERSPSTSRTPASTASTGSSTSATRARPATLRVPQDITVTRDGQPEQVDLSTQSHGRYVVARIGRPDVPSGRATTPT